MAFLPLKNAPKSTLLFCKKSPSDQPISLIFQALPSPVLLNIIAVMFTFSFGSTVAFAADGDSYSYSDWADKLRAEKDAQLGYLANYKAQALAKYDFNDEGYVSATFEKQDDEIIAGYTKAALAVAADAVIDDLEVTMDKNISTFLNTEANYKDKEPTATRVANVVLGTFNSSDYSITGTLTAIAVTSADAMKTALQGKDYTEDLDKAQAPETEKAVTDKIDAVKIEDYNSSDKAYMYTAPGDDAVIGTVAKGSSLTAADAVTAIIDDAKDAIKDGKKEDTDAQKRLAYEAAYREFKAQLDRIDTQADEDFKDITSDTNLSAEVDKYAAFGYNKASALMEKYKKTDGTLESKVSWEEEVKGKLSAFWDENSKDSKDGKLFDIAVSDYTKVTRAEATSIYNAMKDEITKSKAVVTGWINNTDFENASVQNLYKDEEAFYTTLDRAMDAADKYEDVVKEGNKLKAEYRSGVKQYVDSKVDEAVKKAEEFVYGDLYKNKAATETGAYKTPRDYIAEAANDINDNKDGLTNLKEDGAKFGYATFKDAINDAAKKIYENGIYDSKKTPTKKVAAGADKTADEDLVYLKETYTTSEYEDWYDTADDTIDALKDAQSKAEIESIMKKAAEDFGALLKKADESDVDKARDAYKDALEGFIKQMYGLLDSKGDYSYAYLGSTTGTTLGDVKTECPLYTKGADLIDDANTVEAVKTAYAEAQALVTGAKKNTELKDMKKSIEKMITALPGTDKLEASDLDAVKEAYAALAEYADLAGYNANPISKTDLDDLASKFNKVIGKYEDQIEDEAEDLFDKMDEVDTYSDADLAKYTAYKAEAQALIDKVEALNDEISDINGDGYLKTDGKENKLAELEFADKSDYDKIDKALGLDIVAGEGNFYKYEIENAKRLLVEANKPNATSAQMKAALDAFNALTERQQLDLDQSNDYYYQIAKAIADKQGTSVKELKITAKSTAKKGSITVKWTVKGDATDIDGYEIWKSTKQSKGYKKAFTTTKKTYKNSKGLKKGTRYYYKVRAYKVVDGKKITSDWSNKAYRKAK